MRTLRFNALLSGSRCSPCFNSTGPTKRSRACLCIASSTSPARQSEIAEGIARSIESDLMVLAAEFDNCLALVDHARRNCRISSRSNPHVFCISRACRREIVPQDNARVNRADKLCKLVKMESGTMGACDHPTTGQPQRCGRFGSTHCYPCSRCFRCSNSIGSTKRSRACLCMDRARQR